MEEWVISLIENTDYLGLALLSFLENVIPPIPSEIIMPMGGFLVAQGRLNFIGVVLAGVLGSTAGSLLFYAIGMVFPPTRLKLWAEKYGGWLVSGQDVDEAFSWFGRHGTKAVFLCRLVPGIRSMISIPAGSARMPLPTFLLYSALGTGIWSLLLASAGYVLGQQFGSIEAVVDVFKYIVVGLTLLFVAWWIIQKLRRRQASQASS